MKKAKQEHKVEKSSEEKPKKVKDYDYDYIDKLGNLIGKRNFP